MSPAQRTRRSGSGSVMSPASNICHTRTTRYLFGRSPKQGCDGVFSREPPSWPTPRGTAPIERLCWRATPNLESDPSEVAKCIEEAEPRVLFMLDSSLFDRSTDLHIWHALICRAESCLITKEVLNELAPWLLSNRVYPATRAIETGALCVESPTKSYNAIALEYYVNCFPSERTHSAGRRRFFLGE